METKKEDIIMEMVERREIINSRFRLKIILKGISDDDGTFKIRKKRKREKKESKQSND